MGRSILPRACLEVLLLLLPIHTSSRRNSTSKMVRLVGVRYHCQHQLARALLGAVPQHPAAATPAATRMALHAAAATRWVCVLLKEHQQGEGLLLHRNRAAEGLAAAAAGAAAVH